MRVLAVVPSGYDISPGQRYRIEQWEPLLRERGVEITYLPFETPELRSVLYKPGNSLGKVGAVLSNLKRRNAELRSVVDFDLVYLFREAALLGPAWFERKIAGSRVPIVFDFDDAIFVQYKSPSNGYLSYLKFPRKTDTIVRLSTHVLAGNQYLADYAKRFNANVTIVPTTIDIGTYVPTEKEENEVPVIGWSGSHSTVQHLDTVRDALQKLAKQNDFKLRVIGTSNYSLPGVDVEALEWRSATEVEDLRAIDIGIMPLPDDDWSKGKCGLKALQYMALGIPTICSPVGVNTEIIQHGINGILADGQDDWVQKLSELLQQKELRKKLGAAGCVTVVEKYSAASQVDRVHEVFQTAVNSKKISKNGNK